MAVRAFVSLERIMAIRAFVMAVRERESWLSVLLVLKGLNLVPFMAVRTFSQWLSVLFAAYFLGVCTI